MQCDEQDYLQLYILARLYTKQLDISLNAVCKSFRVSVFCFSLMLLVQKPGQVKWSAVR